jgi:hypothetical protein
LPPSKKATEKRMPRTRLSSTLFRARHAPPWPSVILFEGTKTGNLPPSPSCTRQRVGLWGQPPALPVPSISGAISRKGQSKRSNWFRRGHRIRNGPCYWFLRGHCTREGNSTEFRYRTRFVLRYTPL